MHTSIHILHFYTGIVVVDEVHMVCDKSRGWKVDSVLSRLIEYNNTNTTTSIPTVNNRYIILAFLFIHSLYYIQLNIQKLLHCILTITTTIN